MLNNNRLVSFPTMAALVVAGLLGGTSAWADTTLLNVSYDPTRELYQEVNPVFAKGWKDKTGQTVRNQPIAWRVGRPGPFGHRRA